MILISRVSPEEYDAGTAGSVASEGESGTPDAAGTPDPAALVRQVAAAATQADGRSPLNEAALLALRHHGLRDHALWLAYADSVSRDVVGFALATGVPIEGAAVSNAGKRGASETGPVELNLVVTPAARGEGVGRALVESVLEAVGPAEVSAWSHGNHPAAQRLASRLGFDRVRDLWLMRRPLSPEHPLPEVTPGAGGVVVRTFQRGLDEDAWLAINTEAFSEHPEQGAMTRTDLEQRMSEPWFDADGFFVAEPTDAPRELELREAVESPWMLGFHWTKVHDDSVGEVYALGVSPYAQGRGLGKLLTLTGLHHLESRGLDEVILYVEADNEAAVTMYSGLGFTHADEDTDVQYLRARAS